MAQHHDRYYCGKSGTTFLYEDMKEWRRERVVYKTTLFISSPNNNSWDLLIFFLGYENI
jgi:hypothetical protein